MRIKLSFTRLALVFLVLGLVASLSGCGGGTDQPSSVPDPVATTEPIIENPEPAEVAPNVEESASEIEQPIEDETESTSLVETEPPVEPDIQESVDQPVLSWARDAGGLNHCDRLSIYRDGRVEAVVCRVTNSEPTVHGTLTEEQLAQVLAWTQEYASFTSRESEMSSAVRTTVLYGEGSLLPEPEAKREIKALVAGIFFGLTDPE